ncbi:MAG: hypothetical protein LC624_03110 [Halobacteriales archaeon]|nr:hypothetical protein [Halobacteriales archaeon]
MHTHRASAPVLLAVSLAALALAGCTQSPEPSTAREGGGTTGTSADVGGNVTAGNTTAQGNTTATGNTTGNATQGNVTGNVTSNVTANTTAPSATLFDEDASYSGVAPADATFDVRASYRSLQVNVTDSSLLLLGAKLTLTDPGGNDTVVYDGNGGGKLTEVANPAPGTWTLHFEGNGSGKLHVTVQGRA